MITKEKIKDVLFTEGLNLLGVSITDLLSRKRGECLVNARRLIMSAFYDLCGMYGIKATSVYVAEVMNRDHSTVLYHVGVNSDYSEFDNAYREMYEEFVEVMLSHLQSYGETNFYALETSKLIKTVNENQN